jgi:hypothetical protein
MMTEQESPDARAAQRAMELRWLAWSGAALGALMILLGWLMAPAEGSNYAVVLADQATRIEAGMWAGAGIGVGVPVVVWLRQRTRVASAKRSSRPKQPVNRQL